MKHISRRDALLSMISCAGAALAAPVLVPSARTQYPGIRDGGLDHDEIQRRIDLGGEVVLPPGVFDITSLVSRGQRGLHIRGAGIGRTILRQQPGPHGWGLWLVDATDCSVSGLSIDSSQAVLSSGLRTFGCIDTLIEDVEILSGDHVSLVVSGPQFGHGTREPLDNVARRCIVRGQRSYDATRSTAQIIAGGGARNTTFEDCESHSAGVFPGDLFGWDFAPGTRFIRCRAFGHGVEPVNGFWGEGDEIGDVDAYLEDCEVHDAYGGIATIENASAVVRNARLTNIVGSFALRSAGLGMDVDGAIFDRCCQLDRPDSSGGILAANGYFRGRNIVFTNSTGAANVNIYRFGQRPAEDELVHLQNCTFDRPILFYHDQGPRVVRVEDCVFENGAEIASYSAGTARVEAYRNRFRNRGFHLGQMGWAEIVENRFVADPGNRQPAIEGALGGNRGRVVDNTFEGYRQISQGALQLQFARNRVL